MKIKNYKDSSKTVSSGHINLRMNQSVYNPLEHWNTTKPIGNRLVLLSDDTDDRPSDNQKSQNTEHYFEWHTIVIPFSLFTSVKKQWLEIKKAHKVPDLYLHASSHASLLRDPSSRLRKDIHELLSFYKIKHYFTSRPSQHIKSYTKKNKGEQKYHQLLQLWGLNQPRDQALFWHLDVLDKQLPDDYDIPEAIVFSDRTEKSDTLGRNQLTKGSAWFYRSHPLLNHIDQRVLFRIWEKPPSNDSIANCLDLVDYCAWITQRFFRLINARAFTSSDESLTSKVLQNLVHQLPLADQEQCIFFLERLNSQLIKHLDPMKFYANNKGL